LTIGGFNRAELSNRLSVNGDDQSLASAGSPNECGEITA